MSRNEEFSDQIRKRIQDTMERAEEERKREMFKRRLDIARAGLAYYEQKKIKEAVQQFHLYLRILEEGKKVPDGGLNPSHFDRKEDIHELLLISGVYWDLAKIYDRSKSADKIKEMKQYLQKYVIFSKGLPFQPICAETLRKYISSEKAIHREDFKDAYLKMGGGKCFVATALGRHLEFHTFERLYTLRDHHLSKRVLGRFFIRVYYIFGPSLASFVLLFPEFLQMKFAVWIEWIAKKWGKRDGKTH